MGVTRRTRIERIAQALEEQMRALRSLGLAESASLVRIAWLDLRCRNDRISKQELRALCDHLCDEPEASEPRNKSNDNNAAPRAKRAAVRSRGKRPRKPAEIISIDLWRARSRPKS